MNCGASLRLARERRNLRAAPNGHNLSQADGRYMPLWNIQCLRYVLQHLGGVDGFAQQAELVSGVKRVD